MPPETAYERRKRRQREEQEALDVALDAWIKDASSENTHRLFLAGCAYLGIPPDKHHCEEPPPPNFR